MNIVVIGLGSMGKRRIRLIKKYDGALHIYGIDTNEERRKSCQKDFGISTFNSLGDLLNVDNVDCAFICTAPLSHSKIITQCLEKEIHIFSELNLIADGYGKNIELALQSGLVLFMSSTFLYRDEIKRIKTLIKDGDNLVNYNYHVGQYLPDWHPWENYNDFFVGDKRSNGCREIFAIELPWLIDIFGDIKKINVTKSKISKLNIEYNDNYLVMIEHVTGHKGMFAVDVISRKAVRNLEVYGEEIYLQWDGSPEGLIVYDYVNKEDKLIKLYDDVDQLQQYNRFIVENAYFNEIISFFAVLENKEQPIFDFEKDKCVLKIIDEIEAE